MIKSHSKNFFYLNLLLAILITHNANADFVAFENQNLDPRGKPEAIICGQNMENYGNYVDVKSRLGGMSKERFSEKENALVERFASNRCDIIVVQELLAKTELDGAEILKILAKKLQNRTNRVFDVRSGPSNDKLLRLGFLVAKDRANIESMVSYSKVELPKIASDQKPREFSRGPLEAQITILGRDGSSGRSLVIIGYHFKSKAGGRHDPAKLEWETHRMEMAEAIRRIINSRHSRSLANGEPILIVMGDRNSNFDTSSARILEGSLHLKDFQNGACRLSKRGVPLCKPGTFRPAQLFSVLTSDPETKLKHGTYIYNKVYSWLDEISMPAESLKYAWQLPGSEGDYDSGIVSLPFEASDHSMTLVKMNW